MKYRQYKIIHFSEIEDKLFGRAWLVQAKTTGLHPDSDASFMFSDLYSQGEFIEYFIVPYDNEVMDELEGIAQCNELWSPDTDDWTVDEECRIVDDIPVITHHYCGKRKEKAIKATIGNFHIVSWMPLCQLVIAENATMDYISNAKTGEHSFACGKVKGSVSARAKEWLGYENVSVYDFKVAFVSINGAEASPWLIPASNLQTNIINIPEELTKTNDLLEIGQWRQAFPWAKK